MKEFFSYIAEQLRSNPTIVSETLRQIIIIGGAFGLFHFTDHQHDVLISGTSAVLALWTRNQVIPTVFKEREVEKSVLHREATGTGIGSEPTMGTGTGTGARDKPVNDPLRGTGDGR